MTPNDQGAPRPSGTSKPHPNASIVPESERRCVICREQVVQQVMEKVTVDVCEKHGLWLDKEELPRIIERIRMRAHDFRKQMMIRSREEGVQEGINTGPWWWFLV